MTTPTPQNQPANPALQVPHPQHHSGVGQRRELFWQNVVREFLSVLATTAAASGGRLSATPKGAAHGSAPEAELFDGRLAVITRLGNRIPIADVFPVFACSVGTNKPPSETRAERLLAGDVQCTVFQITTPTGEVHTLPIHEIASIHTLSEHLIQRLREAAHKTAAATATPADDDLPFGFAAFTSLARSEAEDPDLHPELKSNPAAPN